MLQLTWRVHRLDQLIGLIPANRLIRDHLRDLSLRSRIGRYKVVFCLQGLVSAPGGLEPTGKIVHFSCERGPLETDRELLSRRHGAACSRAHSVSGASLRRRPGAARRGAVAARPASRFVPGTVSYTHLDVYKRQAQL